MAPRLPSRVWRRWSPALMLALLPWTCLESTTAADESALALKEPAAHRVYQRDRGGRAAIPLELADAPKGAEIVSAQIQNVAEARFVDGRLTGVPTGGPYQIECEVKVGDMVRQVGAGPVFVGDLWVLAGQSNMEGVGDLVEAAPPNPSVMLLGMDGKWGVAEEPLHWLVDSPDPVHSGDPANRAERSAQQHKNRTKGAGLGLPFATMLANQTHVPIGLVACAHGGTSLQQWDPAKKDEGGKSLYGSMLRQVKLAGNKVTGVLWYQGESDANSKAADVYSKNFADFIAAVRADLNQPELPFYYVQIGRFIHAGDPKGWNQVQDAQRRLPERVSNTAVIAVIDLELDDGIHVGTQGLKRAGARLARIALRELFGQVGATTPTLDRVGKGSGNTLIVKFKGVNMGPGPQVQGGMGMGGMGMGGGMGAMMGGMGPRGLGSSLAEGHGVGLKPTRHIGGFSIRKEDGTEVPLIFEAAVASARDTVVLKLNGPVPEKANLWYGHGFDPYCNLTDGLDMAVPVFGPIALDEALGPALAAAPKPAPEPIKLLIITGDHGHDWKATTRALQDFLSEHDRVKVDVTTTPASDLTAANLAKYDCLLLNYKDTAKGGEDTKWSDANKDAFLNAVKGGKGLVVFHHASSAFTNPNWEEFEKATAGGWRSQGFHGPKLEFTVKTTDVKHPISEGLPASFDHVIDELYSNSLMVPGNIVLATAFSDPNTPKGTGKDEPVIWVNTYGKGRVYNNALGHDVQAIADPNFQAWMRRGVEWAATGEVPSIAK